MRNKKSNILKGKLVVQKNELIRGNTSLFSLTDLKIFRLLMSKISKENRDGRLFNNFYEIDTSEMKELNISEKHFRNEVTKSLKNLANTYVRIEQGDSDREVGLIRNDFKFPKYSKKILISFNDDMEEYLLDASKNYTKYLLSDIVNFKFKHTLKLYEYIKSISLNTPKLKTSTLRKTLELIDSYTRASDFRKVVRKSVQEINDQSISISLQVEFHTEKGEEYVIFHIQRVDLVSNDADDSRPILIRTLKGKECFYRNKYYTFEDIEIDEDEFILILAEMHTEVKKELSFESSDSLIRKLKDLYKDYEIISMDEVKIKSVNKANANDFKIFRDITIDKFKNKAIVNNAPGFLEDEVIKINDVGYLTKSDGTVIDKDKSLLVWQYMFKNQDLIGVISDVKPIKKFIGLKVNIKQNVEFGNEDSFLMLIEKIEVESENQYRMYFTDVHAADGKIVKAKNALSYEQLEHTINENLYEEKLY